MRSHRITTPERTPRAAFSAACGRLRVPQWRARSAAANDGGEMGHSMGQAMVEFAAVILPILLILVAVIQFGLLFGANVTLTNAAREGARAATIFVYDNGGTRANND
ncbi:MAG: TadE family protein, partial [Candidatus Limnocylindria bacterium]